jgi:tetratricopeptide (TPR) repeat protein
MTGANISGKSVTTSTVNTAAVFDITRWFAGPRRKPADAADRAAALIERGRPDEALAALDALLADGLAGERRAFALNKRGVALIALCRRAEADAAFADALDVEPRYAPALTNVGNVLLEDGDVEGAIARYSAAIAADEDYAVAYLNLGVALKRVGRANEAVRCLRTAHRLEMRRRS